jgi:hypothetical protein
MFISAYGSSPLKQDIPMEIGQQIEVVENRVLASDR